MMINLYMMCLCTMMCACACARTHIEPHCRIDKNHTENRSFNPSLGSLALKLYFELVLATTAAIHVSFHPHYQQNKKWMKKKTHQTTTKEKQLAFEVRAMHLSNIEYFIEGPIM